MGRFAEVRLTRRPPRARPLSVVLDAGADAEPVGRERPLFCQTARVVASSEEARPLVGVVDVGAGVLVQGRVVVNVG